MMDSGIRVVGWHGELRDISRIKLTRSIETLCNAFEIDARLPTAAEARAPILEGDQVAITYEGALVLRGFCDSSEIEDSGDDSACSLTGRSRTSLLADSSCRLQGLVLDFPGFGVTSHAAEFRGQRVEAIVRAIAVPFKVEVLCQVDTGDPIPKLVIRAGDKAGEVIDDLCKRRGLLAYSDAQGRVVLSRVADASVNPAVIDHFARLRLVRDLGNSYVFYHAVGARKVAGIATDTSWTPEDAPRTLIMATEHVSDQVAVQASAYAERDARWGKATRLEIDLAGWGYRTSAGLLRPWGPGQLVTVVHPRRGLGEDQQWVISEVVSQYTVEAGHATTLTLCYPEALQLRAERSKATAARGIVKGTASLAAWAQQVANSRTYAAVVDGTVGAIATAARNVVQLVAAGAKSPTLPPEGVDAGGCTDAGDNATRLLDNECSRAQDGGW